VVAGGAFLAPFGKVCLSSLEFSSNTAVSPDAATGASGGLYIDNQGDLLITTDSISFKGNRYIGTATTSVANSLYLHDGPQVVLNTPVFAATANTLGTTPDVLVDGEGTALCRPTFLPATSKGRRAVVTLQGTLSFCQPRSRHYQVVAGSVTAQDCSSCSRTKASCVNGFVNGTWPWSNKMG
jgi:hypothetical protein